MQVTFFRPPGACAIGISVPTFPVGIGYMSAILKRDGHTTALVDGETYSCLHRRGPVLGALRSCLLSGITTRRTRNLLATLMEQRGHPYWDRLVDGIADTKPDLVAMTATSSQVTAVAIVTAKLKERLPSVPIVLGGVHATALPNDSLSDLRDVDYVIAGEGEYRLLQLCGCLAGRQLDRLSEIDSLFQREHEHVSWNAGAPRALIDNLDDLPFPDRSIGRPESYGMGSLSYIPIVPLRGCPYNCVFCASRTLWTNRVRFRSVGNVMAELLEISDRTGAKRFCFVADSMTTKKSWFFEFCDEARRLGRGFAYHMNTKVNEANEDVFREMRRSGIRSIAFGIESGSQRILDRIDKGITLPQVRRATELVRKYGLSCTCHFMIGHPGETEDDVRQTFDLAREVASRDINLDINMTTPFPGTQLYQLARETGFTFDVDSYYKLFHQGGVVVNLSKMSDRTLLDWYRKLQRFFWRHSLVARAQKLGKRLLEG